MRQQESGCKGCREEYKVTEEQIQRVLSSPMFSEERCVPNDQYEARLNACSSCPKLQSGTTCTLCGCIVQITAKLIEKRCPYPGQDRWAAATAAV